MRILALIPARSGSKGLPHKNIALLGNRPLVDWTIRASLDAGCFERVVVSTDDEYIASIAHKCGAVVPFLRPAEFSCDTAPAHPVIRHALQFFLEKGEAFDAVAYLQPTSPFRTAAQLRLAYNHYIERKADTLVSITRVPHNMISGSIMRPVDESQSLWLESPHGQTMRRQEKELIYARNGPAILFVSTYDVIERSRLYGDRVLGFEMDRLSSIDIDDALDLDIAEHLVSLVVNKNN